jgi:hypothetical protein
MAYHILSHRASCLPLDLPHREAFHLYPERILFDYGTTAVEDELATSVESHNRKGKRLRPRAIRDQRLGL